MALGKDYELQDCPIARALELVGERWTILVIRDCFFGVRRFNDFLVHLDIPRAVLTNRLERLVSGGMLERREYRPGRNEYLLTDRGRSLWPILHSLAEWGDQRAAPRARIRARLRRTSASQGRRGRSRSGWARTAAAQVSWTRSSAEEGSTRRAARRCNHAE